MDKTCKTKTHLAIYSMSSLNTQINARGSERRFVQPMPAWRDCWMTMTTRMLAMVVIYKNDSDGDDTDSNNNDDDNDNDDEKNMLDSRWWW